MQLLFSLFATFFKIGLFTFGGGYAMLPLMQQEVVEAHAWLSPAEFTEMVAVATTAPGAVAVNAATFVGYRVAGIPGSVAGTLGVIAPSVIIVLLLVRLFIHAHHHPRVNAALSGIRPAVVGMIAAAAFTMGKGNVLEAKSALIAAGAFAALAFFDVHPAVVLLLAGLVGILFLV